MRKSVGTYCYIWTQFWNIEILDSVHFLQEAKFFHKYSNRIIESRDVRSFEIDN